MIGLPNAVKLIGTYGGDETHALSAWTSTSRDISDEKLARRPKLLKFLAENGHYTPFEKSYIHFLITVDTATHIQLLKHRIGVSINGESARYKKYEEDKAYIPADWPLKYQEYVYGMYKDQFDLYHKLVEDLTPTHGRKRAKESARFVLPYASQIHMDVSFNFKSFMHFVGLRYKPDAQCEIRDLAEDMLNLVRKTKDFKESLEAFGYG